MNKETIALSDFLNLFVAYQDPEDVFTYAFAFKSDEYSIVLVVTPNGDEESVTVIKSEKDKIKWHKKVFRSEKEWKKLDATSMHEYVNNDHGNLFAFFMYEEGRSKLLTEEEWLTLLSEANEKQ